MNRLEANRQILRILSAFVEAYPQQRFNQLLQNTKVVVPNLVDQFYEELTETLSRMPH